MTLRTNLQNIIILPDNSILMNTRIIAELCEQMVKEFYSANLYLSMSAWCQEAGLPGCANWMRVQYQEENEHALKFFDYIHSHGGKAVVSAIAAPPAEWKNIQEVFEATAKHEAEVTRCIHQLVKLSREENDYTTEIFLQWFVTEQVEEEENVRNILDQLKLAGENGYGLLLIDRDLATRTYTPTSTAE